MGKPNTIARGFPRLLVERKTATAVISNYSLELQHHTYSVHHHHHNHHQSLNREGCWGTTDDFATSLLHFSLFSTALWDLPNSRPVHSLMLSSHLFLCLPCLLPPFHCALQDGFGQTWLTGNMTIPLHFVSLYDRQERDPKHTRD